MDVRGKTVLILGGTGEVGLEVCRLILMEATTRLIVASSRRETGEREILQLDKETSGTNSSFFDRGQGFWKRTDREELVIHPGEVAGWILTCEEKGERIKNEDLTSQNCPPPP